VDLRLNINFLQEASRMTAMDSRKIPTRLMISNRARSNVLLFDLPTRLPSSPNNERETSFDAGLKRR